MHKFNIDTWLIEGYPIAYAIDIISDEEATKLAQMAHIKYFQRH